MRNLFSAALLFFFSSISFANYDEYRLDVRNAFMILKDGEKIQVADGFIQVNRLSSKIHYTDANNKNTSISIKKLDYLSSEKTLLDYLKPVHFILKTFSIEGREEVYMIIAETANKKLITRTGKFSYDFRYEIFVVDNNNNKIDEIKVYGGPKLKGMLHRSQIEPFLKKNFPDCNDLLNKIPKVSFSDAIAGYSLFDNPFYIKCD